MPLRRSRSTISASHLAGVIRVAEISHQWLFISIASHLVISAHVIERSCASELADTMTDAPMRVVSIHSTSQDTRADLPIPRPDAVAMRSTLYMSTSPLSAMWFLMSRSTCRCQVRGPLYRSSGVPCSPHGNAIKTNFSGLLII